MMLSSVVDVEEEEDDQIPPTVKEVYLIYKEC
jgi:hypothetical protein